MVKQPRRAPLPPTFLAPVIAAITSTTTDAALVDALTPFDAPHDFERPEERSLLNWTPVLDRFDSVLSRRAAAVPVPVPADATAVATAAAAANSSGADLTRSLSGVARRGSKGGASASGSGSGSGSAPVAVSTDEDTSDKSVPENDVIIIVLKATLYLLKNAGHDSKHLYSSAEHLTSLLADADITVLTISLECLHALLSRQARSRGATSRALPATIPAAARLAALSHGWGGRENSLGLVECCAAGDAEPGEDGSGKLKPGLRVLPKSGGAVRLDFKKDDPAQFMQGHPLFPGAPGGPPAVDPGRWDSEGGVAASERTPGEEGHSAVDAPAIAVAGIEGTGKKEGKATSLHVADVRTLAGDEKWLVGKYMADENIPSFLAFPLLAAVRRARAFVAGRVNRIEQVRIRILAISCLSLYHPAPPGLLSVFANDSELVPDAVALAKADDDDGLGDLPDSLRVLAVRFLSTVCPDRHRFTQLLTSAGVASHHGALPSLLRSQMRFLVLDAASESEEGSANKQAGGASSNATLSAAASGGIDGRTVSLLLAENVVNLVYNIAACTSGPGSSGASALVSSGAFVAMIPLLADRNPKHTLVVSVAIRAMECIIESTHSSSGGAVFRNHRGVSLVVDRVSAVVGLPVTVVKPDHSGESGPAAASASGSAVPPASASMDETVGDVATMDEVTSAVNVPTPASSPLHSKSKMKSPRSPLEDEDDSVERAALVARGETRGFYELLGKRQLTPEEALKHPAPSSSLASRGQLSHSTWTLLRALMRLLLLGMGTDTSSFREVAASEFPLAIRRIIARPFHYGGSLFAIAANTAADIAHAEPVVTSALVDAGILKALLRSVGMGLPPSGEAIRCVPNVLAALSLAPAAREQIVSVKPLLPYVARLATTFYGRAMHGETPVLIGNSLDELIRHVESLRSEGGKAMLEFIKLAAEFVKAPTPPELLDENAVSAAWAPVTVEDGMPRSEEERKEKVLQLDKMRLTVASNAARLAASAQSSSEQQNSIIRLNGLEHMFDLRYAPAHAVASLNKDVHPPFGHASRSAATPHNTIQALIAAFRTLCSRHGPAVLKATFEVVKKDAALALEIGAQLDGAWLIEEEALLEGEEGLSDTESRKRRWDLRKKLQAAICLLRVDVIILTGLSRSGPGSVGTWEASSGSEVAAVVASVERAARWHMARVYTGLAVESISSYGGREDNFCGGTVTASDESEFSFLESELALELARRIGKLGNCTKLEMNEIAEAAKKKRVPPDAKVLVRQEIHGNGWALVTFAVSAQTLYSTLSHGLMYNIRRYARDPAMFGASLGAIASAVGRIFALHLKAAESLWDQKVITAGNGKIPAAWDYLRGILIEMRGCFFDDARPYDGAARTMTQPLILKSFLAAGGGEALLSACRPASLASTSFPDSAEGSAFSNPALYDYLCRVAEEHCTIPGQGVTPALSVGAVVASTRDIVKKVQDKAAGSDAEMLSPSSSAIPNSPTSSTLRKWFAESDSEKMDVALSSLASEVLIENRKNAVRANSHDTWSMLLAFVRLLGSCPALSLDAPLPSVMGHASSGQDAIGSTKSWTARDLRRSSQALAISLVRKMLCNSDSGSTEPTLLSPSVVSKLLTFVQSVSSSSAQLTELEPSDVRVSNAAARREIMTRARGLNAARRGRAGGSGQGVNDRGYFIDPYLGGGVLIDDPQFGRPGYYPPGVDPEDPDLVLRNPSEEVPFERIWITREQHEEILSGVAPDEVPTIPGFLGSSRNRSAPAAPPREIDPAHVAILAEMGFPESQARLALRRIRTGGVNEATEWLLMHPDSVDGDDDDDDDEDGGDDDDDDGGGDEEQMEEEDDEDSGDDGRDDDSGTNSQEHAPVSMDVQINSENNADDGAAGEESEEVVANGPDGSADGRDREGGSAMLDSSTAGTPSDRVMSEAAGAGQQLASSGDNGRERNAENDEQAPISAITRALGALPVPVPQSGSINDSILPGGPQHSRTEGRPGEEETSPVGDEDDQHNFDHLTATGEVASFDTPSPSTGLLQGAAKAEHGDLVSVLSEYLTQKESSEVVSQYETLFGESFSPREAAAPVVTPKTAPGTDPVVASDTAGRSTSSSGTVRRLDSVWKEDYMSSKRGLFEELVPFTRKALRGEASASSKVDCSALAVELLLAMQKDGFMSKEAKTEYAKLLTSGIPKAQETPGSADSCESDALLHACALWAHHGGLSVRHALASCNVGKGAVEVLESSILSWERQAEKPTFDEDTVEPIENLSIHEAHDKSAALSGMELVANQSSRALTAVAEKELPIYKKRLTSCLLLLDAFVHFRDDDALLVRCATPAEETSSPGKDVSTSDRKGVVGASGAGSAAVAEDTVEPAIRSSDATKSEMQVDQGVSKVDVNLADEEKELASARADCNASIDEKMVSISKDLASWLFPLPLSLAGPVRSESNELIPYSKAMSICLQLLRVWSGMDAGDAFTALLQLISSLTLVPEMAQQFLDGGGVQSLLTLRNLGTRAASSTEPRLVREFVKTILRHVVEDSVTLREGMECELRTSFAQPSGAPFGGRPPRRTLPSILDMHRNMIQRNPVVFVHALAKVAKLGQDSGDSRSSKFLTGVLTVEEVGLRKGGGKLRLSEFENRTNVKAVMNGLISRLNGKSGSRRRSMSGKLPKASTSKQVSTMEPSPVSSESSDATSLRGESNLKDTIVFALQSISEMVNVFPACTAAFLQARWPGDRADSTALDFVVESLLPSRSKSGYLGLSSNSMAASSAARELMNSLCLRQAGAYQHVADALAKASSNELLREADVRPGAISQFAYFVAHSRRPCVLRAFLSSGIADSLTQSLGEMDLNAEGMGDVIFSVLSALEAMGKVSVTLQQQKANIGDDELDGIPRSASSGSGHRAYGMRRSARSLFETLTQNTAIEMAQGGDYGGAYGGLGFQEHYEETI